MTLRCQPFSPITLLSLLDEIIRDNLVRSALRQNLPAPAGTFSCSRASCYTCSFLNSATSISRPKSNFVIRQPVARHFNAANHSISNIKVCAISPISGSNATAVNDTKSVSFLKLEPFIPTGLTNDFLLFDHIPS